MKIYCIDINNDNYQKIKKLNYIPVGLGKDKFNKDWVRDNNGDNISSKNPFYGEYTFHYWFWKNKLIEIKDNEWIGFCAYRRFWASRKDCKNIVNNSRKILFDAIKKGGSSIRDFKNISGIKGKFQKNFNVYQREGLKCNRTKCKGTILKKNISNRSTFFCNSCQK